MLRRMRRHLGARVVVGVHRVVDEAGVHLEVVQRALVAHPLVGAPLGARVDLRLRACTSPPAARSGPSRRSPAPSSVSTLPGSVAGRRPGLRRRPCVLVSSAGCSTAVCVGRARVDDRELHVGRAARRRRRRPGPAPRRRRRPAAASVPGRACRASSLSGSGPWSSWYSRSIQSDQVSSVRVRTCDGDLVVGDARRRAPR